MIMLEVIFRLDGNGEVFAIFPHLHNWEFSKYPRYLCDKGICDAFGSLCEAVHVNYSTFMLITKMAPYKKYKKLLQELRTFNWLKEYELKPVKKYLLKYVE